MKQMKTVIIKFLADSNTRLNSIIRRSPNIRRQAQTRSSNPEPCANNTPKIDGVAINVSQFTSACPKTCVCSCHMQTKALVPAFLNCVLGQLFAGTAGVPVISTKCSYHACKSTLVPRSSVEYWFPLGVFWSQIVRLQVSYIASLGPQFSLRSLRRVPDSASCVHYAMEGNIEGLKGLFARGLASP